MSVADVLADPDRFVGETLADPLEGADYGRCKAKVMRADDGGLFIHSFAHGRAFYLLRHDAAVSQSRDSASAGRRQSWTIAMAILATSEMEADELADFAASVAKAADIGVRAVMARMAKQRREREQAERESGHGARGRTAESFGRVRNPTAN